MNEINEKKKGGHREKKIVMSPKIRGGKANFLCFRGIY